MDYLGHKIDAERLHPLPHKVTAIQKARAPTNVTEIIFRTFNVLRVISPNLVHYFSPSVCIIEKGETMEMGKRRKEII